MNPSPEEAQFQLALAKPAEKRAAFLDAMCNGDAALRARPEALLLHESHFRRGETVGLAHFGDAINSGSGLPFRVSP